MYDPCDNCNKPCCYGCVYAEEENEVLEQFKVDLEHGWDYAIEQLANTTKNIDLLSLCQIYWKAYETASYKQSTDPDDGLCYEIRAFVIKKILEVLENE